VRRGERVYSEFSDRMERSKNLLNEAARERRRRYVDRVLENDAINEWRGQRREKHDLCNDAKRVMFDANANDIEEDLERRRVLQRQLERENHLLRKTNLNAFHDLAAEEKKILVDLNLRNGIAP
jgi:hypothetical protein